MKRTLKERARVVVENSNTKAGRRFDWFIQFLVVISLVDFSIATLPGLSSAATTTLNLIETFCVAVFTIEYAVRLWVAEKRWRFIFSFYGIIDLLAILPFFLTTGLDTRSIRALRITRMFRLLKLLRYNNALHRLRNSLYLVKEELIMFLSLTVVLLFLCSVGIYYFEHEAQPDKFQSIFDGFWWAIATFTTVGYGDIYPVTVGGKFFTFITLLIGLGIVAVPTALISSALMKVKGDVVPPS